MCEAKAVRPITICILEVLQIPQGAPVEVEVDLQIDSNSTTIVKPNDAVAMRNTDFECLGVHFHPTNDRHVAL